MTERAAGWLYKASPTNAPVALTALRVGVGIIMIVHGWTKLVDPSGWAATFTEMGIPAPNVSVWLATAGELLGGAGLVAGLLTPLASFGVLATMVIAIAFVHLEHGLLAASGGFEYPLTLGLVALYFMARGAGPVSLDALIVRRRQRGSGTTTEPASREPAPSTG